MVVVVVVAVAMGVMVDVTVGPTLVVVPTLLEILPLPRATLICRLTETPMMICSFFTIT